MVAKIITVSTAAQLQSALASATGGETILLAAGNYGALHLVDGKTKFDVTHSASNPVTIRSADADNPAVFTALGLHGTSGFTLENLTFDYTYKPTDQSWTSTFLMNGGSDITIRGCTFDGDIVVNRNAVDDGYGFSNGFAARNTKNLTFENNTLSKFSVGAGFSEVDNLTIRGNDIHSMRSDGLILSAVQGVRIEDNHIHDFKRALASGDHSDMIQFYTTATKRPNTDIVIRNNLLDIGGGDPTQSIFMRNERVDTGQAGVEMHYRNVLIEQNTIYNDHLAGITLGEATGVVIRNNSVLHANGASEAVIGKGSIPIIAVAAASTDVTITNNVTAYVGGGLQGYTSTSPSWKVANNLLVQDQDSTAPSYYSDVFLSTSLDRTEGGHRFLAVPGGAIETVGSGSDSIRIDQTPAVVTPLFNVSTLPDDPAVHVFDAASVSYGPGGAITPGQGKFIWDFGDGTLATGGVVQHRYATPGDYAVTLTLLQPDGTTTSVSETVAKVPLDLLRFDKTTGQFGVFSGITATSETMLALKAGAVIGATGAKVIDLGAAGTTATVSSKALEGLFKADNFELDLRIKADIAPQNWGEVFRLHGTFFGTVRNTGDFQFTLWTDTGKAVNLFSKGVNLLDGKQHDISIDYDADVGMLKLTVDGSFTVQTPLADNLPKMVSSGLTFGNPWGSPNFNGQLSHFDLNVERSPYPVYDGATRPIPSEIAAVSAADLSSFGLTDSPITPDHYLLDAAEMQSMSPDQLLGNARVETVAGKTVLTLGGGADGVVLGLMDAFGDADQIAFTVDFQRASTNTLTSGLVSNVGQIELSLAGDGIRLQVATADEGYKAYDVLNLGLKDTDWHEAVVVLDAAGDRLQVFVDDRLVLDDRQTDLVMTNPEGDPQDGWVLGDGFAGRISAFEITEDISHPVATGDVSLFA